jgi:YHS domain-containing protein
MEKDVVCGMEVDRESAPAQSEYQGRTYYFCAQSCKEEFDRDPGKFVKAAEVA